MRREALRAAVRARAESGGRALRVPRQVRDPTVRPAGEVRSGRSLMPRTRSKSRAPSERLEKLDVLAAAKRENTGIEGDESHLVSSSKGHEVRVGYLPMSGQPGYVRVCWRDVVDQESMPAYSAEELQQANSQLPAGGFRFAPGVWRERSREPLAIPLVPEFDHPDPVLRASRLPSGSTGCWRRL